MQVLKRDLVQSGYTDCIVRHLDKYVPQWDNKTVERARELLKQEGQMDRFVDALTRRVGIGIVMLAPMVVPVATSWAFRRLM